MSNNYNSILVTLKELVDGSKDKALEADIKFNIPIYQRLYVWKEEQIKKLLEDTFNAFEKHPNNDYYLGGVIVVKNGDRYDLIDGQQRFTTLWLIAQQLQENLVPFLENRMHFSIRDHANKFFSNSNIAREEVGELKNIKDAIKTISNYFTDKKEKKEFSEYLYKKLKLVFTVVPQDVDLNKLFETINSGGVQLQHHELLKAKMIEALKDNPKEQKIYSKLWDSCSFMDNYIENNLAVALNCTKTDIYQKLYIIDDKKIDNLRDVDKVKEFIYPKIESDNQDKKSLQDILKLTYIDETPSSKVEKENEIKVRSIISFSMLLLHTLRIYLKEENKLDIKEVNEKELLKIFTHKNKENDENKYGEFDFNYENVTKFLNLLWKVRFTFDEHIIKWVNIDDNSDEVHLICKIIDNVSSKSPSLQRDETEVSKSFSLLQSMLYHTQPIINHYWLTPLLYKLVNNPQSNNEEYLQNMDNHLFFPKKEGDLRNNTWLIMNNNDLKIEPYEKVLEQFDLIDGKDYRQFSHYLFYKVEYILWFLDKNRSNEFYFRAKNSVEHISPQTPNGNYKEDNLVSDNYLHSFGNLALVSRERNSEFGNKPFEVKQIDFKTKKYDISNNFKMSLIYENENWGDEKCKEHLKDIKMKICQYINCGESNELK